MRTRKQQMEWFIANGYFLNEQEYPWYYVIKLVNTLGSIASNESLPGMLDAVEMYMDEYGECIVCGDILFLDEPTRQRRIEYGHIVARSRGGETTQYNLRMMHNMCNLAMGTLSLVEYIELSRKVVHRHRKKQRKSKLSRA